MESIEIFGRKPCEACGGTGRRSADKERSLACHKCMGAGYIHCFMTLRELARLLEAEASPSVV